VEIPQYYRKAEKRLNRLNRKKSKKFKKRNVAVLGVFPMSDSFKKGQKQSNNYQKARKRYARKHLRVSRQRKGFVEKEALHIGNLALDFQVRASTKVKSDE
jgi:putative transposase